MGAARKKTLVSREQQALNAGRSLERFGAQLNGPVGLLLQSHWKIFKMEGVW